MRALCNRRPLDDPRGACELELLLTEGTLYPAASFCHHGMESATLLRVPPFILGRVGGLGFRLFYNRLNGGHAVLLRMDVERYFYYNPVPCKCRELCVELRHMLRDEILATLSYYDVHDMPLTAEEIFRYLIRTSSTDIPTRPKISECCETLIQEGVVGKRDGYFFLFGREYIVPLRAKYAEYAQRKWRITRRTARLLAAVPFIRLLFVSGSLSFNNTDELSDLDVVIVAKHGRIWTTRLLVSALLSLLGMRRRFEDRVAPNKICPNHFITNESLHIPFQNMYTAQLYANLVPVSVTDPTLLKEFQIQNEWLFHYMHHWQMSDDRILTTPFANMLRTMGEKIANVIGDWLEAKARDYQKRFIIEHARPVTPGGHLTYTDEALAFHAQSSASAILAKYENSQSKLTYGLH